MIYGAVRAMILRHLCITRISLRYIWRKDREKLVTMKFYDALQMDPAVLKRQIAVCETKREKTYYWVAMAVRSALIVAFAIVFISLLSGVFGSDNTPLAVALFCMMLGIRFVNFQYCIGDSLVTLAAVLAILEIGRAHV